MYESARVLKESGYVDLHRVIKVDVISADYLETNAVSFHPETKYLSMDFQDSLTWEETSATLTVTELQIENRLLQ